MEAAQRDIDMLRVERLPVSSSFRGHPVQGSLGAVYYNFPHAGAVSGFFDGPLLSCAATFVCVEIFGAPSHEAIPASTGATRT